MGVETAKSSIFTNQKSLDIVGNNLAIVDTEGYTRQRVDRAVIAVNTATQRVAYDGIGLAGQGVQATSISQMRDAFLDKRFREENAQASFHDQSATILSDIQSALGDGADITDESGLLGAIQQIYQNLQNFIHIECKALTMNFRTEDNIGTSYRKFIVTHCETMHMKQMEF